MRKIFPETLKSVRHRVWNYYRLHGRDLPWRHTHDPYCILVSEIMLQQTQVSRVIPFYKKFLKRFPTLRALSRAGLSDVLAAWQGLGYNRRARYLKHAAQQIVSHYRGRVPETEELLRALPGVGVYTARAVCAFAYNQPKVFLETNIRTVLLHHFFPHSQNVSDSALLKTAEQMLDTRRPREWYWALMDYGAYLKARGARNTASKHYKQQSAFEGSKRQVRGAVLRAALSSPHTFATLTKSLDITTTKPILQRVLEDLIKEGLLVEKNRRFSVPR